MKKNVTIKTFIFACLLFFTLQPATDPDTGWHLATGRYIIEQGQVPRNDPFSYSMPNAPYYAHSWAFDVGMYLLEDKFGPIGLSAIFAVITTASMVLFALLAKRVYSQGDFWGLLPLLTLGVVEICGVRPQAVSVLGLAVLLVMLTNQTKKPPLWRIPLLFLIWANLHGGVVLGIGVFALWIIGSSVQHPHNFEQKYWLKSFVMAFFATLINPYTYHLYTFAFSMVTNRTALTYNADWIPLFSGRLGDDSLPLRISIVVGSVVAIIDNRNQKILGILTLIFLSLSLKSLRFLVPLLPVVAPLILITLHKLTPNNVKKGWFALVMIAFTAIIFYSNLVDKNKVLCTARPDCYGSLAQMPYGATAFIKKNGLVGNFFNYYTWGGYLEWQAPQSKYFIDGRMDNFFIDGKSFLEVFVAVDQMQEGWYESIVQYQTDFALLPSSWQQQARALQAQGWRQLYQDEVAILLEY